jgi:5-formyltetrahydrofolate cyclo-ligase
MDGTKREIRQEMRRRRQALSAADERAAETAVVGYVADLAPDGDQALLIAYVAIDHEVPTGALIASALAAGKRVYLPRFVGGTMWFAEYRHGSDLRPGAFGIPEPLGAQLEERDVAAATAVVPLLAWDASGSRVGRGGGHYDRAFGGPVRPACLIGLGYAFQQCAVLPQDPWDLRLDWVVTEQGALRCWRGDDSSPSRREDATRNDIPHDGGGHRRAGRWAGLAGGLSPAPTGSGTGPRNPRDGRTGSR